MYPTLITFDPMDPVFVLSMIAVVGVSAWLWLQRRRRPGLLGVWVGYLALMTPLLGWTEHPHFAGDRYSYLAGVAWAIVIGGGVWWLWNQGSRRWMILPLGGSVALLLAGWTQRQIPVWKDSIVLHRHIITTLGGHPYRHKLYLVLGTIYQKEGDVDNAELAFREVLAIATDNADAHSNLGDILVDKNQFQAAQEHYKEAIRVRPGHANARQNLGIALAMREDFDQAAAQFRELLRYHPDNALAHHNLSLTLASLGQAEEAQRHRQEAQRLQNKPSPGVP